jgi:hypothetical protein
VFKEETQGVQREGVGGREKMRGKCVDCMHGPGPLGNKIQGVGGTWHDS